MSIFSSQTTWPPNCSSANQSPVNLSQSIAKPCNLSCDITFDDDYVTKASVSVSNEALILENPSGLGSCKYRGATYVCQAISVNHPSHHTIEGVQTDGEITAFYRKPTGELLCVSSLFRVNPAQTPSYSFFKQFVPYAITSGDTQVALSNWSTAMMIPPGGGYYVYSGSTLVPPCTPCEWVVYKSIINMDTTDFAYLVRNVQAGSRSVQAVGNRDVFFNDTENSPGAMPHDNKFYLRLRPTGNTNVGGKVKQVDLKGKDSLSKEDRENEEKNPSTIQGKAWKATTDQVEKNGGIIGTIEFLFFILLVVGGLYLGYRASNIHPFTAEIMRTAAIWVRQTAVWLYNFLFGWVKWLFGWLYNTFQYLFGWIYNLFKMIFSGLIPKRFADEKLESVPQ